jgi:hypothetical protein
MDADGIPNERDADANGDGIPDDVASPGTNTPSTNTNTDAGNTTDTNTEADSTTATNTQTQSTQTQPNTSTGSDNLTTAIIPGSSTTEEVLSATEQAQIEAQSGNPIVDLANGNVPLGATNITGAWSLASLLLAIVAFVIALIQAITLLVGRPRFGVAFALALVGCVAGVIIPLVWLSSDRLHDSMVWLNSWTPIVGVALAIQLGILVTSLVLSVRAARSEKLLDELLSLGATGDQSLSM